MQEFICTRTSGKQACMSYLLHTPDSLRRPTRMPFAEALCCHWVATVMLLCNVHFYCRKFKMRRSETLDGDGAATSACHQGVRVSASLSITRLCRHREGNVGKGLSPTLFCISDVQCPGAPRHQIRDLQVFIMYSHHKFVTYIYPEPTRQPHAAGNE